MFFRTTYPETPRTLTELAFLHRLDKGDYDVSLAEWHTKFPLHDTMGYTRTYDAVMKPYKHAPINFLEIGIADPRFPFGSCQMWRRYFSKANLYGLDNLCAMNGHGISTLASLVTDLGVNFFHGDQGTNECLEEVRFKVPDGFHFIVDDGSHLPADIISSFNILWPAIVPGGTYFIEDVGFGLGVFGHENAKIVEWARDQPVKDGTAQLIRSTSSRYEIYLIQITKRV